MLNPEGMRKIEEGKAATLGAWMHVPLSPHQHKLCKKRGEIPLASSWKAWCELSTKEVAPENDTAVWTRCLSHIALQAPREPVPWTRHQCLLMAKGAGETNHAFFLGVAAAYSAIISYCFI